MSKCDALFFLLIQQRLIRIELIHQNLVHLIGFSNLFIWGSGLLNRPLAAAFELINSISEGNESDLAARCFCYCNDSLKKKIIKERERENKEERI